MQGFGLPDAQAPFAAGGGAERGPPHGLGQGAATRLHPAAASSTHSSSAPTRQGSRAEVAIPKPNSPTEKAPARPAKALCACPLR